jgi:hypothetical protein
MKKEGGRPGEPVTIVAALALCVFIPLSAQGEERPGVAIDAKGGAVVDPTENVKALNEAGLKAVAEALAAALKRQDDLRTAQDLLFKSKMEDEAKITDLQHQLSDAEIRRIDQIEKFRVIVDKELREAEAKRIDAIRTVDVQAVQVASSRADTTATALASQVTQSAEVLRNQVTASADALRTLVATTAATAAQNEKQQFDALSTRIAALENGASEGQGKRSITDPALIDLVNQVRVLANSRAAATGADTGQSNVITWVIAGFGTLALIFAVIITLLRPGHRGV